MSSVLGPPPPQSDADALTSADLSSGGGSEESDENPREKLLANGAKREPERLARYELREEIGRGGMGVVYKAHDPKLNRPVAIKLITKDDPKMRDRFQREAQAIAKVKHPNVIDIYDTDFDERGRPYIAMEYVDGQTLKAWLQESQRDIYDIFKVFAAAGRGLEVVHEHGIVHHDFKPDNVLIAKDNRVLVADFGLARASFVSGGDRSLMETHDGQDAFKVDLTQTGALLGTLHYMAPELLDKIRGDVRTDQFAFCVSLYEALTGERFFQLQGKEQRYVYEEILRCEVKPLPRVLKVPRSVEVALRKGLSARPANRHASMGALTDLLERVSKRPERRRWFTWAAIGFVAVLALVGALVVTLAVVRQSSPIADFEDERADLDRDPLTVSEPKASPLLNFPATVPLMPTSEAKPGPKEVSVPVDGPKPVDNPRPKPKIVEFELHVGGAYTAVDFDFGPNGGKRTISTVETIRLPATQVDVKCREYDANTPRAWKPQTLDLGVGKRKITCSESGPKLQ